MTSKVRFGKISKINFLRREKSDIKITSSVLRGNLDLKNGTRSAREEVPYKVTEN